MKLDLVPYSSTKLQKNSENRNRSQTTFRQAHSVRKVFPKAQGTQTSFLRVKNTSESASQKELSKKSTVAQSPTVYPKGSMLHAYKPAACCLIQEDSILQEAKSETRRVADM
jgi:hypothetical protein